MEMNTRKIDVKSAPGTRPREVVCHFRENIHAIHRLPAVSETVAGHLKNSLGQETPIIGARRGHRVPGKSRAADNDVASRFRSWIPRSLWWSGDHGSDVVFLMQTLKRW